MQASSRSSSHQCLPQLFSDHHSCLLSTLQRQETGSRSVPCYPVAAMTQSPPPQTEHQRWTFGLIGFYLSCAGASLGAAIAFGGHFFFESQGALVFGLVVSISSCVTCYVSLRSARRKSGKS